MIHPQSCQASNARASLSEKKLQEKLKEIAAKEAAGEELTETEKLMKTWPNKKKGGASEGTKEQLAALRAGMKLVGAAKEPKEKTQ